MREGGTIWDGLRGHGAVVDRFRAALARGRMPQAVLLAGPAGVGKRVFAEKLARCLLCTGTAPDALEACGRCPSCRTIDGGGHPDLFRVSIPEGKREIPLAAFVGDDESRGRAGLCYDLSRRLALAPRRVAIVEDTDAVRTEAANAFLKTLEEPPPASTIVLIADRPDALLPTIRSRVQTVRFAPLPDADVAALALSLSLAADEAEAEQVARLARGSLDAAAKLADPAVRALRDVVREHAGRGGPVASAKALVKAVEEAGSDAPSQRAAAAWVLAFTADGLRARLAGATADETWDPAAAESAAAGLEVLLGASARLARNSPVPAVVEHLAHALHPGR